MALTASKSPSMLPNGTEKYPFLIELTAKRWKGLILLAFIIGFLGMFLFFWQVWAIVYQPLIESGFVLGNSPLNNFTQIFTNFAGLLGCLMFLTALAIGFFARFMAWWRHG